MKTIIHLALRSLANRKVTSALTILAITLSMSLLLVVERVRIGARDGFTGVISQTDVIAGARTSPVQLLLQSVFQIGSAANNVSPETWDYFRNHPAVSWTIPISMGDSHRGYRVIATNSSFFKHYRYQKNTGLMFAVGQAPSTDRGVVIGASVAKSLGYKINSQIVLAHGLAKESFVKHEDSPFTVVGILAPTGTPFDRSLFISLEAMHQLHEPNVHMSDDREAHNHEAHNHEAHEDEEEHHDHLPGLSAILIGTKARTDALALQREIQTYEKEALTAILPGLTLAQLWEMMSYAEDGLRIISTVVIIIGLLSMVVALYNSLNERRREMAILRALGARPWMITATLITEASLITGISVVASLTLTYGILFGAAAWITTSFGLKLPVTYPSFEEWSRILAMFLTGLLMAAVPAWRAYRNTLVDGLTIRL